MGNFNAGLSPRAYGVGYINGVGMARPRKLHVNPEKHGRPRPSLLRGHFENIQLQRTPLSRPAARGLRKNTTQTYVRGMHLPSNRAGEQGASLPQRRLRTLKRANGYDDLFDFGRRAAPARKAPQQGAASGRDARQRRPWVVALGLIHGVSQLRR